MLSLIGDPRHLWKRYLVALSLLSVSVVLHHVAAVSATRYSDDLATAINDSGRQRMLSQRITLFSGLLLHDPGRAQEYGPLLATAIDDFETSHDALLTVAEDFVQGDAGEALHRLYFGTSPSQGLDADCRSFVATARAVLAGSAETDIADDLLSSLGTEALLPRLDRAVGLFEGAAVDRLSALRRVADIGFYAALLLIALEGLLIFLPAHRAIRRGFDDLERTLEDLRRSEANARESLAQLSRAERSNVAKTEFLSQMSHELRTPLNSVIGFSEMILSQGLKALGPGKTVGYLEDISQSGRHLRGIINDILDLSEIEHGRRRIDTSFQPIEPLVDRAVAMLSPVAQSKDISITVKGNPLAAADLDEQALLQCLINILDNAIKYSHPGGIVQVFIEQGYHTASITIADQGVGFSKDILSQLGEPFIRRRPGEVRREDGIGLGLTITQRLMDAQGGEMVVRNRDGDGASVTLQLHKRRSGTMISDPA